MRTGGADLADPEVPRAFRRRFVAFLDTVKAALGGGANDLSHTIDWLRSEQQPLWKRRIREAEEDYQTARRAWLDAESETRDAGRSRGPRKESSFEERLAMDRARRRREEAEARLELVRHWLIRLERDGAPLVHICRSADLALRDLGERAVIRLDQQIDAVERYLERAPARPPSAAPSAGNAPCLP